jgi:hypothetical protein
MSDQAYADLLSMGTTIDSGDTYLKAFKYENAVTTYQTAGTQGQSLRSELPPSASLDQADALNQTLQALGSNLASQATAEQAQALAKQLFAIYSPLIRSVPVTPSAPIAKPTDSPPTNWAAIALGGLVAVGIGGLFYLMIVGPEAFDDGRENPTSGGPGPKRKPIKRALINKGRACHFIMKEGPDVHCGGGMLHDPSGRWWPKNSILCGPFKKVRAASDDEGSPQSTHYLGSSHRASIGVVDTPPRAISDWTYVGEVDEIRYTRMGRKRPGRYFHIFSKPGALATIIKGKGKARLYRHGRFCRLDLPRDAILDSRGLVWP